MYVPLFVFFYLLFIGIIAAYPTEVAWVVATVCYLKLLRLSG
jgi:hypothetical protein